MRIVSERLSHYSILAVMPKRLLPLLPAAFLLWLVHPFIIAAQTVPAGAVPTPPADYIVYHDSSGTCSLKDVVGDCLVERGEDASSVIQKAIDLLSVSGGKVYIAAGSYRLESTIVVANKHGVHIEGAARGMQGRTQGGTVLWSDKPINLLEIYGGDKRVFGVTVTNLLLYGSGVSNGKAGIWVHGTTDAMTLANVGVNHCGIGIYLQGGRGTADSGVIDAAQIYFCDPQINGIGLLLERAHYTKVFGGEFSDCVGPGIRLSSPGGDQRIQSVKIVGVTAVRDGGAGIFIGSHCEDITVTGGTDVGGTRKGSGIVISSEGKSGGEPLNIICDGVHSYNNEVDGINVSDSRHVIISNSICSVHDHAAVTASGQRDGIRIGRHCRDVVVIGNIVYGNAGGGIVDLSRRAKLNGNSVGTGTRGGRVK